MRSRFEHLRDKAISLRRNGASLKDVESKFGIPRSTLSYWFKDVELTKLQEMKLTQRWKNALVLARKEAVKWHNAQKNERIHVALAEANHTLEQFQSLDNHFIELALAMLYLGEGHKKNSSTSLGNSDPLLLRFFIASLQKLYNIPIDDFRCELHLRLDQKEKDLIRFWSKSLGVKRSNFNKTSFDSRSKGKPTYAHYKGVCVVSVGRVAIMRKLMYIANGFCTQVSLQK